MKLAKKEKLISVCPECLAGLSVPRVSAEIHGGDGKDVIGGNARVIDKNGIDTTEDFIKGAEEVFKIACENGATEFISKSRSPSCGCGKIYDGTFSKTVRDGDGVTAAFLKQNGIKVLTEEEL